MWAALSSFCVPVTKSILQEKHSSLYLLRHALFPGVVKKVLLKRQTRRAGSHILKSCVPVSSQELSAGPLLQVCTCRAMDTAEVLEGGNLLETPQQLRTLSQPSAPDSWYLRIHPHGSRRVLLVCQEGYGWQCGCSILCMYQYATWSLNGFLCPRTVSVQWYFS